MLGNINFKRGFLRVWIVLSALWLIAVSVYQFNAGENPSYKTLYYQVHSINVFDKLDDPKLKWQLHQKGKIKIGGVIVEIGQGKNARLVWIEETFARLSSFEQGNEVDRIASRLKIEFPFYASRDTRDMILSDGSKHHARDIGYKSFTEVAKSDSTQIIEIVPDIEVAVLRSIPRSQLKEISSRIHDYSSKLRTLEKKEKVWRSRKVSTIAAILPPIICLLLGLAINWMISGFKNDKTI